MKETTYLVETWRYYPYREVIETTFDSKKFALFWAEATSRTRGVECTKVFSLTMSDDCNGHERELLIKIGEFE